MCFADFAAAPKEEAEVWIRQYHSWHYSNPQILLALRQHFDMDKTYGLGSVTRSIARDTTNCKHRKRRKTKLKMWLREWGLKSTKAQGHTFETISGPIQKLRKKFPTAGAQAMRDRLRLDYDMRVPRYASVFTPPWSLTDVCLRELILKYNRATDPAGVAARRAGRIRRRIFYSAGVNHVWAFDQHDKWKRYGLRMHLGIEPFAGFLLWLIVWWTNSNPKLVGREYFRAARKYGGMWFLTLSDNDGITLIEKVFQC